MSEDDEETRAKFKTAPFDPRFPNQNQTLNCFVNYVDYHRCRELVEAKDKQRCEIFKKLFTSICPNQWISNWDDQREQNTFPAEIVKAPDPKKDCKK